MLLAIQQVGSIIIPQPGLPDRARKNHILIETKEVFKHETSYRIARTEPR